MASIDVNGISLNYRLDGDDHDAPVVMLSNSLAANLDMWEYQVPALVAGGYRVLRYDTRGHGQSSAPDTPYSIELLAADAVALMDRLGLDKVHFCGLSMGGMTGQMLATRHAERLVSLSLCATAAYMGPADLWNQRIQAARDGGMAAVVDGTLQRWFTPASQIELAARVAKVRTGILTTPVTGFCNCCAAIRDMDQRETIRVISLPTLVLVGAEDPSTPVAAAQLIHERIAGSELVVIPASQHFFNMEKPDEFNTALLRFLRRIDRLRS